MNSKYFLQLGLTPVLLGLSGLVHAYPLDGYETTGIGRLEAARRIEAGEFKGDRQPRGALLPMAEVDIRLRDYPNFTIPEPDPELTRKLVTLLGDRVDRYQVAILDLSQPDHPRYAAHQADYRANVGSVGKLLVALAVFQTLADLHPDDLDARKRVLRDTHIEADDFVLTDHHTVRIWDRKTETLIRKRLAPGDMGTYWEFLDWMMSASSNAAASTVIEHAMLLKRYGRDFPLAPAKVQEFFATTPKPELGNLLAETLQPPVARNGMDLDLIRQGSLFTATGQRKVPGTTSYATPRTLLEYLLKLEQGKLVDDFSSREIKRLMYSTERRIRYASAPALNDSAVYFKSGSLFECRPEPGFRCFQYHGNVKNLMNSVAIVEAPAGERKYHYLVALMSNVLRRNSAYDHQTLAAGIHELITTGDIRNATLLLRGQDEPAGAQAEAVSE
ncbi:MAG: hypothetical protein EPO31_11490 [Gammaproteobacteria bacterium]|nr:MAG: hypothetical protein EPO31_11490 [Gammaproteobacteria bacterium]